MPVFVDTNVLVYARDASEPDKQPRALDWIKALWESREGRVSSQILQEYYVAVTRKLRPGLPAAAARADVRNLLAWQPFAIDAETLEAAWQLEDRYRLSTWDALVVAAARLGGCEYLLTEDLQDGQDLGGVEVVNPFSREPAAVL